MIYFYYSFQIQLNQTNPYIMEAEIIPTATNIIDEE